MKLEYPKVLIFGQPFNNFSGGGITLTNLFKGWPKDKIAVTYLGHGLVSVTSDVCETYYQLGEKEHYWKFPFSLVQKKFRSGLKVIENKEEPSTGLSKKGLRYFIVNKIFYPALEWLGLFHCVSGIELSKDFKTWLSEFKPDVLYIQVATRETLLFAGKLNDHLKIPSAIHNMDDWPSTISRKGLFRNYWKKKIDKEFKCLLDRMDLFLSISDAMSSEYRMRYGKEFKPFHNPIDTKKFTGLRKKSFAEGNVLRILYLGRIGMANKESLYLFSKAVSAWAMKGLTIHLDIFTPDVDSPDSKLIKNLNKVRLSLPVKYYEVPALLAISDLLLLPLDFNQTGLSYAQYSIPTKASEYMMSGTPIIVFAPSETAISKFCTENDCAYCLAKPEKNEIFTAIQFIVEHEDFRKKWTKNAVELASKLFDASLVRENFQTALTGLVNLQGK
jgi:glycosyltransferase involved in cell wall biosynthesis